ncbi:immunoglobulin domain-containing protein [Spirosoma soli]|uniref:Immunoglobulin domain-containing protein n=1 Tax=Spirosoma soli TaxID=1770529 RepID=A0ABW5M991_9BACT
MLSSLRFSPAKSAPRSLAWLVRLLMVLPWLAQAQCPNNLATQAQVDAFPPGCVNLPSLLIIEGANITNLNSLSVIQTAGGLQITNNPLLSSLGGLDNLTSVRNGLDIQSNAALTSLQGLNQLASAGGLDLRNNPRLTSLNGLENLKTVENTVLIQSHAALTSLQGLNQLTSARTLDLRNNPRLTSLSGLENLRTVTGTVLIQSHAELTSLQELNQLTSIRFLDLRSNPKLTSLSGLENLRTVTGEVLIHSHAALTSLQGLNQLTSAGRLDLRSNPKLTSLSGLENLGTVTGTVLIQSHAELTSLEPLRLNQASGLSFENNPKLSYCANPSICALLAQGVSATIRNNAPGCNSVQDIQADCSPLVITTQPPTQSAVCVGGTVTAAVTTSDNARAFQWYKGNEAITGQTTNMLSLSNVQPADAGMYRVVVSNSVSSLTSTAFTLTVNTQSPDYQPLVDLYNSTGGANWTRKDNWLTGCTPCGWYGVTCDDNGRVTQLDLTRNGLAGPIPASLSQLTSLQRLQLVLNQLSGLIPVSLSNLTNLDFLGLGRNQLTGTIPPELSNLTRLTVLALDNNKLEGAIPASLSALTNLQAIFLSANQLSGSMPAYIGSLSNLNLLWLDNNQLSGIVPASLGNLAKLTSLFLNNNQLSGCFPASLSSLCGRPGSTFNFSNNTNLPGGGNFGAFCASGAGSDAFRPLATASPNPVCAGTPVSLSVSAGTFYQWSGPAGFTANTQSPGFTPASAASSGLYSVTVGNGSPTCTATASVSLTVNALPTVSVSPSASTVCAGQTVTLSATPGLSSYRWSTGQNTASIAVTTTGTYSVTATNASGCPATASASVTVSPTPPTPTLTTATGQPGQLYAGGRTSVTVPQYSGTVTLASSGCPGGTIRWSGPNNTSGTGNIVVPTTSTGTLVYQAVCQLNNCTSSPTSATVTVRKDELRVVAPLFDCATNQLTLRTTGGNGKPIEYHIASITNGWSATNPVTVSAKDFRRSFDIDARQKEGDNTGYDQAEELDDYELPACGSGREAASQEQVVPLSVVVLGNPVRGQEVSVEVRGAEGQPLGLQLTNLQGRTVVGRTIQKAGLVERQTFGVGDQPAGLLLLRVSTPSQSQTVKVLKSE